MRSIIILAVLIAGALPGSAVAATVVAHGSGPDAVVDRDGVTHLVWNEHHDYNTPDVLHYCRIPPGAAACDSVRSFVPTASGATADFNGPHVMVTPFGEVLLYTERCCATTILGRSTQAGVVYTSADGGTTFDSGVATVSNITTVGGHRVFFDGADRRIFTLALTSGGVSVQGAPLGQWTTARAQLTTASPVAGNIVQRERNSFVAAWAGLNDRLNIRTFTCTLDPCPQAQPNSAANWSPVVSIPDAGDPILASGPSGTFVAYPSTVAGDRRWSVRTLDGTAVGAPLPIGNGYSAGADLIEDAGGILHMAYQGLKDLLVYRTSADGGATWGAEKVIIPAGSGGFSGTRLVARTTDAGFVGAAIYVAGTDSIVMAPLPAPAVSLPQPPAPPAPPGGGTTTPPPPPAPPAPPSACRLLSFAAIDVVAEGCLVRDGDAYVATGNVKLNGLKAEGKLRFEPNQRRIVSTGPVTFKLGDTTLMKLAVDWTLPKGSVASVGTFDVGGSGGSLLGFPIKGSAEVKFRGGGVEIPLHLGLPALFGGVSGDLTVRADNVAGVHLRELHVKVGDALIGPLELKNLAFDYNADEETWGGAATLVLPPQPPGPSLAAAIGFAHGALDHLRGELTLPAPGIVLDPFGATYLKKIRFELKTTPHLQLKGGVTITSGPTVAGVAAIQIDGDLTVTIADPVIIRADGRVSIVNVPLANAFFELRTDGQAKFGGHVGFSEFGLNVTGDASGEVSKKGFDAEAKAQVCVGDVCGFGGSVVFSSEGFAGCADWGALSIGGGYKWGGALDIMFGSCDIGPYRATVSQAGAARTVTLKQPGIVAVAGAGQVTLTDASGRRIQDTPGVATHVAFHNHGTTYLKVPAGTWRVEGDGITSVKAATVLPRPRVTARVRRGRLSYSVKPVPGQTVTFLDSGTIIGRAHGRRGTLRFAPAPGPGGRRRIVAVVDSYGKPRARLTVASYVAPGPVRPARVKRLRARGRTVTWAKAAGAVRYDVRVAMADGQRRASRVRGTRLVIPAGRATVTVAGVSGAGTRGRSAQLRVVPRYRGPM